METTDPRAREVYRQALESISTVDGREALMTYELREFLSEGALHRYRAFVDIEALIALSESDYSSRPEISDDEKFTLRSLTSKANFDSMAVAEYDHFGRNGIGPLEHDIKAVEINLRDELDTIGLGRLKEWIHFPMTSEDTNNIAFDLMLRDAVNKVWMPKTLEVMDKLADYSVTYAEVPVLGITHGMKASPTTIGKRFSNTLARMSEVVEGFKDVRLSAKFSGPVGNHNAMLVAAPDFDYESFARNFVEGFGFEYEDNSNQRSSHLSVVDLLGKVKFLNYLAADLCENVRHNVMMGWLYQEGDPNHTGSSVMPNKINPWFFEVGQGYFEKSSSEIDGSTPHLLQSVFERDLTDHPHERSYGEMLGKSLIGMSYVSDGLDTIRINDKRALAELRTSPEVLSEAVQIVGRICGVPNIYMTIKNLTRGRVLDRDLLDQIILENIPDPEKQADLINLTPEVYIGKAPEIAVRTAEKYKAMQFTIRRGVLDESTSIDAVLLDLDGTLQLGDKEELYARLSSINDSIHLGFNDEEVKQFVGSSPDYKEIRKAMVAAYSAKYPDLPMNLDIFQTANDLVTGSFDDMFYLADGSLETIDTLKAANKKVGVVTTRGITSAGRLAIRHKFHDKLDTLIGREHYIARKPYTEPLQVGLEILGVRDPRRALYVGNENDDIVAGNALGMKTARISSEPLARYDAPPTYHIQSLKQIAKKFGR